MPAFSARLIPGRQALELTKSFRPPPWIESHPGQSAPPLDTKKGVPGLSAWNPTEHLFGGYGLSLLGVGRIERCSSSQELNHDTMILSTPSVGSFDMAVIEGERMLKVDLYKNVMAVKQKPGKTFSKAFMRVEALRKRQGEIREPNFSLGPFSSPFPHHSEFIKEPGSFLPRYIVISGARKCHEKPGLNLSVLNYYATVKQHRYSICNGSLA